MRVGTSPLGGNRYAARPVTASGVHGLVGAAPGVAARASLDPPANFRQPSRLAGFTGFVLRSRFWTQCVQNSERGAFQICDALRHTLRWEKLSGTPFPRA